MAYTINKNDGTPIIVVDEQLNQDFSIDLLGRNYEDYGAIVAQTQVSLLENFASTAPPVRPTTGQLWYDLTAEVLRVYNFDNNNWRAVDIVMADTTAPTGNLAVSGTSYYNKELDQLFVHDGTAFRPASIPGELSNEYDGIAAIGNPDIYGTRLRTIFLLDDAGVKRAVTAVVYTNTGDGAGYYLGEKIVAIISGHDTFIADNGDSTTENVDNNYYAQLTETDGIGTTIVPGINMRADNLTRVPFADVADRALTSYQINLGTGPGDDQANVWGYEIFYDHDHSVPSVPDTYDLGSEANMFANAYITSLYLGNGNDGYILPNGNSNVYIGSNVAPITEIYVENITVEGDLNMPNGGNIGSETEPVTVGWFEELHANVMHIDGYTMPTSAGGSGQQLYIDGNGQVHWADMTSNIAEVDSSNTSIIISYTPTVPQPSIGSDVIDTQVMTLDINDDYVRGLFSSGANIDYDANTGVIALDYYNPFEGTHPSTYVRTTGDQFVSGIKTFSDVQSFTDGIDTDILVNNGNAITMVGTANITFYANGFIHSPNDVSGLSDRSVKTNLEIVDNPYERVRMLTGYTFDRIDLNHERQAGLISNDVEKAIKEATSIKDGKTYYSQGGVNAVLVEAVKQLIDEVEELKRKLGE